MQLAFETDAACINCFANKRWYLANFVNKLCLKRFEFLYSTGETAAKISKRNLCNYIIKIFISDFHKIRITRIKIRIRYLYRINFNLIAPEKDFAVVHSRSINIRFRGGKRFRLSQQRFKFSSIFYKADIDRYCFNCINGSTITTSEKYTDVILKKYGWLYFISVLNILSHSSVIKFLFI